MWPNARCAVPRATWEILGITEQGEITTWTALNVADPFAGPVGTTTVKDIVTGEVHSLPMRVAHWHVGMHLDVFG